MRTFKAGDLVVYQGEPAIVDAVEGDTISITELNRYAEKRDVLSVDLEYATIAILDLKEEIADMQRIVSHLMSVMRIHRRRNV